MNREFTREELYTLVWSKPTRTIAKELGISDVALGKTCRKLSVCNHKRSSTPPRKTSRRKAAAGGRSPPAKAVLGRTRTAAMERAWPAAARRSTTEKTDGRCLSLESSQASQGVHCSRRISNILRELRRGRQFRNLSMACLGQRVRGLN